MKGKRLILSFVAVVAALCSTASGVRSEQQGSRGDLTEEFHQTYQLAAGGRVSLENINGDVRVRGWDRNEVKVDAVKRAFTRERLQEAEIVVNASGGSVRIETRYPHESMSFTDKEPQRRNNPATVEYTLMVPRGARIHSVELINGALDIEGLTGEVDASSINGRVNARGLTGRVKLSVINGRLDAAFDQINDADPVTLSSVNGPLTVTLPSDADAEVRANTVHGPISNDFNLPVRKGKYVGHDMAGRFGQGGARIKLDSVNGPIQIKRAQDGRPQTNVTNLLSESARGEGEWDDVNHEIERGVREAQREAQREAREAVRETERERREAIREAQRERLEHEREKSEAKTEAEREKLEAKRETEREKAEALREKLEAQREAQREAEEARREIAREVRESAREISREVSREVSRETSREVSRAMRGEGDRRQIETESNTIPAAGVSRVRVANFDGPITVVAWDRPEVKYTAVKRAHDEGEMQGIRVIGEKAREGELIVAANFDKSKCHSVDAKGSKIVSFSCDASVELEVYVPRNTALNVNSSDGRLRVEGVRGELDLRTGDGSIDVTDAGGRLRANTGDGRIRIIDFQGEANAETGDGRILLEGDFSQLAARTGDGSISLAIPEGTNAVIETDAEAVVGEGIIQEDASNTSRGLRRWKVGSGGTRVFTLRTGDGQIILRRR